MEYRVSGLGLRGIVPLKKIEYGFGYIIMRSYKGDYRLWGWGFRVSEKSEVSSRWSIGARVGGLFRSLMAEM